MATGVFENMFPNICRLCGNPQSDYVEIFSDEGIRKHVQLNLLKKINIEVSVKDPLPKIVCCICSERLEFFARFYENCHKTQSKLMNVYLDTCQASIAGGKEDEQCNVEGHNNSIVDSSQNKDMQGHETPSHWLCTNIRNTGGKVNLTGGNLVQTHNLNLSDSIKTPAIPTCVIITKVEEPNKIVSENEVIVLKVPIHKVPGNDISKSQSATKIFSPIIPNIQNEDITQPSSTMHGREIEPQQGSSTYKPKSKHKLIRTHVSQEVQEKLEKISNGKFRCKICGESFHQKFRCVNHIRIHLGEKPFVCNKCGHCFIAMHLLRKHSVAHEPDSRLICQTCGRKFRNASSLKGHEATHSDEPAPFSCHLCDRSFYIRQSYLSHMETHNNERGCMCEFCSKSYKSKRHLKEHIARVHEGLLRHTCSTCNKGFYRATSYRQHLRLHTSERPFRCEVCGRAFNEPTNLKRHVLAHNKIKKVTFIRLDVETPDETIDSSIDSHIDEVRVDSLM